MRTPRGSFADGNKNSLKAKRPRSGKQALVLRQRVREGELAGGLRQESQ